jgi:hypothetical protein
LDITSALPVIGNNISFSVYSIPGTSLSCIPIVRNAPYPCIDIKISPFREKIRSSSSSSSRPIYDPLTYLGTPETAFKQFQKLHADIDKLESVLVDHMLHPECHPNQQVPAEMSASTARNDRLGTPKLKSMLNLY